MDQKLQDYQNEIRLLSANLARATGKPANRREELIAECDQLRRDISREFEAIEHSLSWVSQGMRLGGTIKKGGLLLTGLSGLMMAWKLFKGQGRGAEPAAEAAEGEEASGIGKWLKHGLKFAGVAAPILKMVFR